MEMTHDTFIVKRAVLYTMTAIDHILQAHFSQSNDLSKDNFLIGNLIK